MRRRRRQHLRSILRRRMIMIISVRMWIIAILLARTGRHSVRLLFKAKVRQADQAVVGITMGDLRPIWKTDRCGELPTFESVL